MPVPADAFKFQVPMDPAEVLDYEIRLRENPKILEDTESMASWTLQLYPEATALGLELGTGAYAPADDGVNITLWFQVNAAFQQNAAYDGAGAELAMELNVDTNNVPPRKRQRTIILPVKQL